ncbi:glycoside hydrolase family 28 protein [Edaphobacter sp. 12200R-103]|uniref:glycoside hydrolase family 28 protein n=1 Tax=Edaphobacter sp. 12200R-103 TaxID=2703788 RepID=UPI00138D23C0|nr:glycoside hydrolase family 28 protein [Edaphobacter sp. 12200R-103]QHS53234.1 glycoside hydrolase family 28 protein [Edaphobacter sp. 12200R-103]
MNQRSITLIALLVAASMPAAAKVCKVQAYGAKPDGTTKNTKAIQAAIDDCAKSGGGIVKLSGGVFLSGPIVLKSNTTLDLDKDTTLLGSPDHTDYPAKTEFRAPGTQSLVSATNAQNIAITGSGTIDGNGESWWVEARATHNAGVVGAVKFRPRLVVFDHCKHVRIEGVTIQNSPSWQVVPYYTDDTVIRNVRILAPQHSPNTDAIDPFSSSNMIIDHVYADVGDDNIAIKSGIINSPGPDEPSKNITITDCEFMHGHGLSIGSEIAGGANNIHAERIHFKGTDQGIRIKANRDRGNQVYNISFKDITMEDVKTSILISEYYPKVLPEGEVAPAPITRLTPFFHDITIENISSVKSGTAGVIVGLPEAPVKNVVLKNINITAEKGMTIAYANVTGSNVHVIAASGQAMTVAPSAKVDIK